MKTFHLWKGFFVVKSIAKTFEIGIFVEILNNITIKCQTTRCTKKNSLFRPIEEEQQLN